MSGVRLEGMFGRPRDWRRHGWDSNSSNPPQGILPISRFSLGKGPQQHRSRPHVGNIPPRQKITTATRRYQKPPLLRKQKNQKNKGRSNQDDMSHQNNFTTFVMIYHCSGWCKKPSIWSSTMSSQHFIPVGIELPARPVVLPKKPPKIQSFSCWNIKPCEDGAPRELLVPDCHLTKSSTCSCVQ